MSGTVDWHFEKEAAERDIRTLSGVVGVSNQVLVKPTVSASSVKDNIEQALRVPSRDVLELADESSGDMRLTDHAARSMI